MNETSDQTTAQPPRKRWWLRVFLGVVVLCMVAGVYGMSKLGTQMRVPQWAQAKIIERINAGQEEFGIGVGDVFVIMQEGWKPRLLLSDVRIRDGKGAPLLNLSDVAGTFALKPLMQGELQPASVQLSGARVKLRRLEDGAVDLSLGEAGSTVDQAANFAALIEDLGDFLDQPQFATLKRISAENLSVQFDDARANRSWTVDGGRLGLTREGQDLRISGDFALLGGRDYATTLQMNYSGRIGSKAAELGISFQDMATDDIAGQSPALAWLSALKAPISGALRVSVDQAGALGPLNATLQIGEGVLQPTDATDPIAFTSASSYFTYDPTSQTMEINEVSLVSNWVSARAEGNAALVGIENGLPREILSQMRVTEISANPAGLYPEPITLQGASMDARLQIDPFVLTLGQLSLSDQGSTFAMHGALRADPDGWDLAVDGRMDRLTPERLVALWPTAFADGTREWIDENVRAADLHDIKVAVRARPDEAPDVSLGFDFDKLTTRFMKKMPEINDASGHGVLHDNRFTITAHSGHINAPQGGKIDVSGTSFIVPDVNVKRGPAQALLSTESTITAVLSLIDQEPLKLMQKAKQPVTLADGRARVTGQLDFSLKPKLQTSDVDFAVKGTLTGVRSELLAPGRVLQASELTLVVDNDAISVGGEGQIGTVPFDGTWQSELGAEANGTSRVTGQIELSNRFTEEFRIGLPPGTISGAGRADVTIELARGAPGRFSLSSNLVGVGLSLKQLNWSLPQGAAGTLIVNGQLGTPPSIDTVSLDAGGLSAQGAVNLHSSGALDRASFSQVRMGTWIDAPVDLIGRGAGTTPAVRVRGGRIDLRQTSLGGAEDGSPRARQGGPVNLALDRLVISDGIVLTDFRANLETSRGVDGNFTGKVNGGAVINGRVVPQGARSAFRIKSENAGAVMVSAGLLQNARDGKMDLILTPAPEKGSYNGRLGIDDFRIRDIPSMAALLNAVSVIGILEQLQGDGLHFNRFDATFQLSPDRVTLTEGSATGASLGISMDGYYYMASKRMDMQGVFSPIYLVNAIGGIFTRKGEGLFGFTYTIKGPADAPVVSVNPLSALTPGMFRDLFRRAPPKVQRGPVEQDAIRPAPRVEPETPPVESGADR